MASPVSSSLAGRRIFLGVSGGIAAYKAVELLRLLTRRPEEGGAGADEVRVVMTPAATEFVRPLTFQTLSGFPVGTTLWDLTAESEIGHITLAQRTDLVVVAPATADLIGRYAAGLADDLLTTVLLATTAPVLLAPAMNPQMYAHPAVQANLATLRARGVGIVEPTEGELACKSYGPGRLAEPPTILEAILERLAPTDLAGVRLLVTAGPTREPLDPVRYLSNRSSGPAGAGRRSRSWPGHSRCRHQAASRSCRSRRRPRWPPPSSSGPRRRRRSSWRRPSRTTGRRSQCPGR